MLNLIKNFGEEQAKEALEADSSDVSAPPQAKPKLPESLEKFTQSKSTTQSSEPKALSYILVVEDDRHIRSLIKTILELEGHKVCCAANGQEAMELLLKSSCHPQLILLDLMMPVMDGYEFRRHQLSQHDLQDIPVMIISADNHSEAQRQMMSADDFMHKPIDVEDFLERVRKLGA